MTLKFLTYSPIGIVITTTREADSLLAIIVSALLLKIHASTFYLVATSDSLLDLQLCEIDIKISDLLITY